LAATINLPIITENNRGVRITWPAAVNQGSGRFSDLPFASITEYRSSILQNHYVALLKDGAFLQISADVAGEDLVGHRYCYYPCPVLLPAEFDVLDFDSLDLYLMDELDEHVRAIENKRPRFGEQLRMRSPLRFDFAPHAATQIEPACHLHLSNHDTRIPVHAPLSLGDFVQFVFRNFYPQIWEDESYREATRWPVRVRNRTITEDEEVRFHINCRRTIAPPERTT